MRSAPMATAVAIFLSCGAIAFPMTASGTEPSEPALGPPAVYEDAPGDVADGPDLVACSVSEPWQSLVSFGFEFASVPPLGYDLTTGSTDTLMVFLATNPEAVLPEEAEYVLGVHGATLAQEVTTGANLYDNARSGDQVLWRVTDVEVDGAVVTLTVDRKLLGDPSVLYFLAGVASEGEDEPGAYDTCPDEASGPGQYAFR